MKTTKTTQSKLKGNKHILKTTKNMKTKKFKNDIVTKRPAAKGYTIGCPPMLPFWKWEQIAKLFNKKPIRSMDIKDSKGGIIQRGLCFSCVAFYSEYDRLKYTKNDLLMLKDIAEGDLKALIVYLIKTDY